MKIKTEAPSTFITSFVADRAQWREVRARALVLGVTASEFLRTALAAHLTRTAKEARKQE
jgi:hypothetical protein